jgi:deoxyguanosine kinase
MSNETLNYIAVEGVIGVGKTSLVRLLSERLEAGLLLEEAAHNPFLTDFYRNRERFAFPTQIFFLLSRYQQQQQLVERDLFIRRIIADYMFDKDSLFARVTLSARELVLYEKVAEALRPGIIKPDLVIYLQASTPTIMERIRSRDLPHEKPIDTGYINELNEVYNDYFFHYTDAPVLVVKTDEINFIANEKHLNELVEQIKKPQTQIRYYAPSGDLGSQIG